MRQLIYITTAASRSQALFIKSFTLGLISRYCSLVIFREVFFVNIVHRKPENFGAKSCICMIFVHREARCCERSEQ